MAIGNRTWWALLGAGGALAASVLGLAAAVGPAWGAEEADPALKRTREQVQMLDSLYKNAVVSITKTYDGAPAIRVAMKLFAAMEKDGYHKAKLVDVTGSPQNDANLPRTDFEKHAAKAILAGETYYEQVVGTGDDRRLLAATAVPAVLEKCAACHGVAEGDLLGFIRFEVPVK